MTPVFENDPAIATIYLGGGTPSLLHETDLQQIFKAIYAKFTVENNAEITLEANPDDIAHTRLAEWKRVGINRLSIGIQSFFEADLQWMNRAHDATQAAACIPLAQDAGFNNVSIDLIYGTPTLTDENWNINISKAVALGIPHLSCYALTVEPKTALQKLIGKNLMQDTDPEQQARQFLQLISHLNNNGYEQYEISNFSVPGKKSRHNTSYWQSKAYYGFGPSAHSFDGHHTRSWNVSNNALYIQSLQKNKIPVEKELLTPVQQLNEYIMTALRTSEGINIDILMNRFGKAVKENVLRSAILFMPEKMIKTDNRLYLTDRGKLFADGIAAAMFQD